MCMEDVSFSKHYEHTTVNGERFTGLIFQGFHSFQEYRESFFCEYKHLS